jgi:hypothetical protein
MKRVRVHLSVLSLFVILYAPCVFGADHTVTLTARQEQILDDYIATETSDPKPTKEDVIRQAIARLVTQHGERQRNQQRGRFMDSAEALSPAQKSQIEAIVGQPVPAP